MFQKRRLLRVVLAAAAGLLLGAGSPARAAKDVFIRSKPHVRVGTFGGEAAEFRIHTNARLSEDGKGNGILQLRGARRRTVRLSSDCWGSGRGTACDGSTGSCCSGSATTASQPGRRTWRSSGRIPPRLTA